jgi:hypothetical protein
MTDKTKVLKIGNKIRFVRNDPMWGVAEFVFCPIFKRGKMKEMHIYRKQQEKKEHFVIDLKKYKVSEFEIASWTHKTDHPRVWRNSWCDEHKTIAFEVYPPVGTDIIRTSVYFGTDLEIMFENEGERENG